MEHPGQQRAEHLLISAVSGTYGLTRLPLYAFLQEHASKYQEVVAVVDPPRAGLHWSVLNALVTCPALSRLVYVSCCPDSLMHNVTALCQPWAAMAESGESA